LPINMNHSDEKTGPTITFSQPDSNFTRICIGTQKGFLIFSTEPFKLLYKLNDGGCRIVKNLGKMIVTTGIDKDSRLVKLYKVNDDNTIREIFRIPFEIPILNILLNEAKIIFVLENEIYIYDTTTISFKHKVSTALNPKGIASLSKPSQNGKRVDMLLAYPKKNKGDVTLLNTSNFQEKVLHTTHTEPPNTIQFNYGGDMIATSSEDGTVIKVYSLEDEKEKYQFRRATYGFYSRADVSSIAFNKPGDLMTISSSHGTIHVFDMKEGAIKPKPNGANFIDMLQSAAFGDEARSFCTIQSVSPCFVGFSSDSQRVFTLSDDGKFEQWAIERPNSTSYITGSRIVPECPRVQDYDTAQYCDM